MFSKKGETESNTELWFLIMALAFGAILGISLLDDTLDRLNGDDLKKKIIAGEIALIIDAAHAASHYFEYTYSLPEGYHFCVTVDDEKNQVEVRDKPGASGRAYTHRIVRAKTSEEGEAEKFLGISESIDNCGNDAKTRCKRKYIITKPAVVYDKQENILKRGDITFSSKCQ